MGRLKWSWSRAEDILPGVFGDDENADLTNSFTFVNEVNLNETSYYKGEEIDSRYVNENQANSITSNMIVDNTITGGDIAPGTIDSSDIDMTDIQAKIVGTCDSGEVMVGIDNNGDLICQEGGSGSISEDYDLGEYLIGAQHTIGLCLAEGGEVYDTGGGLYICKFSFGEPKSSYECYESQYVTAHYKTYDQHNTVMGTSTFVEEGVKEIKIGARCILLKEGGSRFNLDGTLKGEVTLYINSPYGESRYPIVTYEDTYVQDYGWLSWIVNPSCPTGWAKHDNFIEQESSIIKLVPMQCDSLSNMGSCSVDGQAFGNHIEKYCSLSTTRSTTLGLFCQDGQPGTFAYSFDAYAPITAMGCK